MMAVNVKNNEITSLQRHSLSVNRTELENDVERSSLNGFVKPLICRGCYSSLDNLQAKLTVGPKDDEYEREADRVADQVMSMPELVAQRACPSCNEEDAVQRAPLAARITPLVQRLTAPEEEEEIQTKPLTRQVERSGSNGGPAGMDLEQSLAQARGGGSPLGERVRGKMENAFGFDFSAVRIHSDARADGLNRSIQARAFTRGQDIFLRQGEYHPASSEGQRLLVHELTHVVQQSRMTGNAAQRGMIQRTTIGQILDNFFSPFSRERLWIMPESDNYTRIVRTWQPVIDAINRAKAALAADCAGWRTRHMTDSAWRPGRTDPPVTDPNANPDWIARPPGTDPRTCRNAFIIYGSSKASKAILRIPIPEIQTFELYTCSIGSFGIYATVDSIDCAAKTARLNIWMYNAMDRDSFGQYARHRLFAASGMERQYMWWNWHELHRWGPVPPAPAAPREGSERKGWVYG